MIIRRQLPETQAIIPLTQRKTNGYGGEMTDRVRSVTLERGDDIGEVLLLLLYFLWSVLLHCLTRICILSPHRRVQGVEASQSAKDFDFD
jgi:hypothetical protein